MEALLPLLILVWDRAGLGPPAIRGAVDDGRVSLTELRGYPVVLNFWHPFSTRPGLQSR